tara:strand:- start:351 stop:680 length:330 start_codon:yes stop_codon:yes gene_type:complete
MWSRVIIVINQSKWQSLYPYNVLRIDVYSRKFKPFSLGSDGRLFWTQKFRDPPGVAKRSGSINGHEHSGMDGFDIRQHRQLLLGSTAPFCSLCLRSYFVLDNPKASYAQ